jgi:3-hydroxyisobutyrate dehydrogenase-like beta-hydroxyacid dehydrogenase
MGKLSGKSNNTLNQKQVGLIGIGLVGTALAKNLIASGFQVIGYDIDPDRMDDFGEMGGILATSPSDVSINTNRIILSLLNSEIVKEVIWGSNVNKGNKDNKGILESNHKPKLIIDTTTGDPFLTEQIAADLKKIGITYLDATLSGSSVQIGDRDGVFLIGGEEQEYHKSKDIFDALAKKHMYVGGSGMGSRSKLAVNLIVGLNRLVLAEGLIFAEKLGLQPEKTLDIFTNTQAYSKVLDAKGKKMIKRDFTTQARVSQHKKDVDLILTTAKALNIHLPLSEYNNGILGALIDKGDGDLDVCAVINEMSKRILTNN